ncbi:hypothetical protein, partial [Streptomyces lunaelactis]|uniref:hypothetical protein n=1 Tax=Streptomyces lunaelactis TaxID=1535768 RepID=UPI001C2FC03A
VDFLACYGPLSLSSPGKPSGPGTSLQFLPVEPGIQQSASWRTRVGGKLGDQECGVVGEAVQAPVPKAVEADPPELTRPPEVFGAQTGSGL